MVDRVERLTNLLALLLETAEPLSLIQISSELVGQYPDQEQARRAAFERDKAALREIGVPIDTEMVTGGAYAGQTRYRIDRRAYELSDLELDTDEMHALQVAVAAVRTDSTNAQDAIWKLGGMLGDGQLHVSASLPERPELPAIRAAVAARASIEFSYRGELRKLDPWGLLLRGGFWYVIGHDHLRGERRTFRIDRFDGGAAGIIVGEGHTFERPESFDPRSAFPADPKQIGHAPDDGVEALVEVDAVRSSAVERELGSERVVERRPGGAICILVPASNLDAFRSWLFGLLDHAVVLEPPEVRTQIIEWLSDVARERTT
ncbi:MAG: WYL domain-containing protein [Actinobacteria bacterium]|jgi:proteasome accessory factor B|nr:WYL domain-containing protein [Actinomycetota bacterium]